MISDQKEIAFPSFKCEIFDRFDLCYFYTSLGDFADEIKN